MRIIDGHDWSPDGTVTTWLPSETMTAAYADTADDPTPASFLQTDHVRGVLAGRALGRRHHAYTCSVATLPGVPNQERLTRAVNDFVAAHEGLRSTLSVDGDAPDGSIRRRTVPADAVDLVPAPVTGTVTDLLATTAVFDHAPALAVVTVAREDGRSFDLLLALDHACGDGISQMTGLLELMARYTGDTGPAAQALTAQTHPSFLDYVRDEHERAAAVGDDSPGVRAWRGLFEITGGRVPDFPLPTGIVDGEPQPVVGVDGVLADPDLTRRLRALTREHQVSFSTVVYAALGLAHAQLTGEDHYATVVVSATRGRRYAVSQGWFCNFTPLYFPVSGTTVEDVLPDVVTAQVRLKAALDEPVHASLGHLILSGQVDPSVMGSPQMVTYLDLGWFEEPDGADVRLFTGFGRTSNANLWVYRNADGLGVGSQAPDNPTARQSVETYVATVHDILAAV